MDLRTWAIGLALSTAACGGASGSPGSSGGGAGSSGGSSSNSGGTGGSKSQQGGSSSQAGSANAGGTSNQGQPDCDAYFDELDKSCETANDCKLVQHQTDCCGTILVMGVASEAGPDSSDVEQYCAGMFPLCGCAARGLALEDGSLVDFGSKAYAAECHEGQCRSHSLAATLACGPQLTCTAAQYCREFIGGPAGSEPSYGCDPLGDCKDCACLQVAGCECSETGGNIKVFCAAP